MSERIEDNEAKPSRWTESVIPHAPRLVYLGPEEGVDESSAKLDLEGEPLAPGTVIPLVRRRSPWKRFQEAERVILGADETRADVLLRGAGVRPEHVRFYLNVKGEPTVFRPLHADSTWLDGRALGALEWLTAHGGEEIAIGAWRFRYECDPADDR